MISSSNVKSKNRQIEKTIKLYSGLGLHGFFPRIRFWDAPFIETERMVPKNGLIIDLGCGEGIFTNFLGLASKKRKVLGIEISNSRITLADRGVSNVKFARGDVTKTSFPRADAIVLFHLLHHLKSTKDQEKVIRKCIKSLKKNGRIVIVEIDPKLSIKYVFTWITDHFIVPIFFEGKIFEPYIAFRKKKEWVSTLHGLGLECKTIKAEKGKPFSHIIIVAAKTLDISN